MRILITGAATGIGALAAVSLARAGHRVHASMRDTAATPDGIRALEAAGPDRLSALPLDVTSDASVDAAAAQIERAGGLDVIVHNAAHLYVGVTEAFTPDQLRASFEVNAIGAARVNRAFLPGLRRQGSGLLLWIGSGTTRAVPPFLGPYSAAKAAFDALAESTAWDVAPSGIETTVLMPGVFTTGTAHFANAESAADPQRTADYPELAPYLASMRADTERLLDDGADDARVDPQIVADEIVRVVGLPTGTRPRRAVADASDYGAEIINGAAEELRLRLARRMHVTGLLGEIA